MNLAKKGNLLPSFSWQKRFLLFTLDLVIYFLCLYRYRVSSRISYVYIYYKCILQKCTHVFFSNPMRNLYMIWMLFNSNLMKRKSELIKHFRPTLSSEKYGRQFKHELCWWLAKKKGLMLMFWALSGYLELCFINPSPLFLSIF